MSVAADERSAGAVAGRPRPLAAFLSVLILVELFSGVLQVYFTPVYATLGSRFHVGIGALSWALTGFTLATAVSTPVFAKLGDVYGHRKVLRVEVALVALGSVLIAVAPNFPLLVLGRVLQGTYAAYLPLMFGLVRSRYSQEDTRRAVSYLTSVLIFGVTAGLVVTGLLMRWGNGPGWAMWLPAIGTLLGFVGLVVVRGEEPVRRDPEVRVDWPGAVLLGVGLALLLFGLSEGPDAGWGSVGVLGGLVAGALVLVVWCAVELRSDQPLADLRFLFKPHFVPVYVIGFCVYFTVVGGQVVGATFMAAPHKLLGYGLGLDALHLTLWLGLTYLVMFLTVLATARLGRAIGFRAVMLIGAVCTAVGLIGVAADHGSLAPFLVFTAIAAGGFGFIESSTRTVVVDGLREGEIAMGEGIYELSITVGAAIGSAVIGAVLAAHASKIKGLATQAGYETAWQVMAGICVLAAVVAAGYLLAGRGRRGHRGEVASAD